MFNFQLQLPIQLLLGALDAAGLRNEQQTQILHGCRVLLRSLVAVVVLPSLPDIGRVSKPSKSKYSIPLYATSPVGIQRSAL